MRIPADVQRSRDAERLLILQGELQRATNPGDVAALQREIARTKGTQAPAPFAAGPSSIESAQGQYDVEAQKDLASRRKSIYDAGDQATSRINDYQRLGELLSKHDGGSLSGTGLQIAKTANSMGLKIDPQLANKEAALALSNQMALSLRNPAGGAGMPGSLSDGDRQFLSSMVPGLETSSKGRAQILQASIAIQQRNQEVAQFARRYESKYGRLDNGFFDQLQAWSNANPIFTKQGAR